MLFNIKNWSKNKVAWFYAIRVSVGIVLFSTILHLLGIYEGVTFRFVFVPMLFIGFMVMIWNYTKYHPSTTFVEGFLLCARMGLRVIMAIVPIILLYLSLTPSEVSIIQAKETFGSPDTIFEVAIFTAIELVAGTVVTGICASFLTGFRKR